MREATIEADETVTRVHVDDAVLPVDAELVSMGWDGMRWDGMGWDGMGWDGITCP